MYPSLLLGLLFTSLFAVTLSQTPIQGFLGTAITIQANTLTTINFGPGIPPSLIVQLDTTANLTVNVYASANTLTLPTGYTVVTSPLNLGVNVALGFTLSISPSNANVITANLTTGPLSTQSQGQITGGVRAGCLQFDTNTNTYQDITVNYSPTVGITVPLPSAGVYILVAVNANVPLPSFYEKARALVGGVQTAISYASGLVINVTATANTAVTVTFNTTTTYKNPNGYVSLNAYFDINLSTQTAIQAVIKYNYTANQLAQAGLKSANQLAIGFYDTAAGAWNFAAGSQVDANAMVVSTTTTHFSTWGVYGSNPNPASATTVSFFLLSIAILLSLL
jgi:hypothetical protein